MRGVIPHLGTSGTLELDCRARHGIVLRDLDLVRIRHTGALESFPSRSVEIGRIALVAVVDEQPGAADVIGVDAADAEVVRGGLASPRNRGRPASAVARRSPRSTASARCQARSVEFQNG